MQNHQGIKLLSTIKDCYLNEGFTGFFKGLSMPLANISFINAGSLAANEFARKLIKITDESKMTVLESTYCGFMAGVAVTPIVTPVEFVKCKLQMQKENKSLAYYKGVRDLLKKTTEMYGIKGIYKGNVTTFFRETIGYGIQFGVYHYLKLKLCKYKGVKYHELKSSDYILAGASSGMLGWVASYPFDTVKSIIQTGSLVSSNNNNGVIDNSKVSVDSKYYELTTIKRYNYKSVLYDGGIYSCLQLLIKHKGIKGIFSGLTPICIATFIGNGVMFLVYEHSKQFLDRINKTKEI
jgi:hypothetical protein